MADIKKYVLGTEYVGGNSETCVDLPKKAGLRTGVVVSLDANGVPQAVGTGVPYGVSGFSEFKVNSPVMTNGLKVCVRVATGKEPGAIGTQAKATEDGEISTDGTINLAGIIASAKIIGIDPADNSEVDAVLVDMPNGL